MILRKQIMPIRDGLYKTLGGAILRGTGSRRCTTLRGPDQTAFLKWRQDSIESGRYKLGDYRLGFGYGWYLVDQNWLYLIDGSFQSMEDDPDFIMHIVKEIKP